MLAQKGKISFRQALILYLTLLYSPAIRYFPAQASKVAKQAGWLTPFISFFFLVLLILIYNSMFKTYKKASLMEVINDITGKYIGSLILILYAIWLIILLALYIRYYAIRISITVSPITDINFFIIVMIIVTAISLKYGLVTFSRSGEILFFILTFGFFILLFLSIPHIKLDNLTPVSYLDIVPLLKSSYNLSALWIYLIIIFFFSDKINDLEMIKKTGFKGAIFLAISNTLLGIMAIGISGYSVLERASLPFFISIKNISVLETISRIEALTVTQWVIADFILIVVFSYSILCILRYLLNLSSSKSFAGIFMLFMYIFSLYISSSQFELQKFSNDVALKLNTFFGMIIPIFLFIIGKIRKKI